MTIVKGRGGSGLIARVAVMGVVAGPAFRGAGNSGIVSVNGQNVGVGNLATATSAGVGPATDSKA